MTVFENEQIEVKKTDANHHFLATITNKTDVELFIVFANGAIDPISVDDWVGIEKDWQGTMALMALRDAAFAIFNMA